MNRYATAAALAVLCGLGLPAHADEVDDAIHTFIGEDGLERQDIGVVERELGRAFLNTGEMRPGGAASAIETALLLIDNLEPRLLRVRYMVRYGQMMQRETPVSFVTVERYNLGPAIRQMVIEDYGEENTADPEEFGVGPHVEWRIVTMPVMGQTAALLEASRREIDDGEAVSVDCGGRGCLSYDTTMDDLRDWREIEADVDIATAYPSVFEDGASDPAFAAAELSVVAGLIELDGDRPFWRGPEQPEAARGAEPFLFVGIDFNLGQDSSVDAMLGQTLLNDDAIAEIWYRRIQFPDEPPPGMRHWMQAAIERSR